MRASRLEGGVVLFLVLTASCGGAAGLGGGGSSSQSDKHGMVGLHAPAFSRPPVVGHSALSTDNAKGKVLVVDFWATYCTPCEKEFPKLQALADKHGGKMLVYGLSEDETTEGIAAFVKKTGVRFPIGWDEGNTISQRYKLEKMPTSYVVDKKGSSASFMADTPKARKNRSPARWTSFCASDRQASSRECCRAFGSELWPARMALKPAEEGANTTSASAKAWRSHAERLSDDVRPDFHPSTPRFSRFLRREIARGRPELVARSRQRPDAHVRERGHGAIQRRLHRQGKARLSPGDVESEVHACERQTQRPRKRRSHGAPPHALRDARQLRLWRLFQRRRHRLRVGALHQGARSAERSPGGHRVPRRRSGPRRRRGALHLAQGDRLRRRPHHRARSGRQLLANG